MDAFLDREGEALKQLFQQCSCGSWAATTPESRGSTPESSPSVPPSSSSTPILRSNTPASSHSSQRGNSISLSRTSSITSAKQSFCSKQLNVTDEGNENNKHMSESKVGRRPYMKDIESKHEEFARAVMEGRPNSASEPRASFTGTYAHLLAYSLPRTLTKQLVRDAFGADHVELPFWEWCQALSVVASKLYPACKSEVASLQSLIRMVKFASHLCRNVEDFIHALSCVGVLNISFCYWDAYRLHRRYASRGFRGLLQALRATAALEKSIHNDLFEFAQRLLYVDKSKKPKLNFATLSELDELSSRFIELYPDLGLGCTFVDFVDYCVADGLLEILSQTKTPAEVEAALSQQHPHQEEYSKISLQATYFPQTPPSTPPARPDSSIQDNKNVETKASGNRKFTVSSVPCRSFPSQPHIRNLQVSVPESASKIHAELHPTPLVPVETANARWQRLIMSPLRRAFDEGPDVAAWLRRTGVKLPLEQAEDAWSTSHGDFNRFINHVSKDWESEVNSIHPGRMTTLRMHDECIQTQTFGRGQDPLQSADQLHLEHYESDEAAFLLGVFNAGCASFESRHASICQSSWARPMFYGFVLTFASGPLTASLLLRSIGNQTKDGLGLGQFASALEILAVEGIRLELPLSLSDTNIANFPFASLVFDLDLALCIYCLGDTRMQANLRSSQPEKNIEEDFQAFVSTCREVNGALRISRIIEQFAPIKDLAAWTALVTAFVRPCAGVEPGVMSMSSIVFMYHSFAPHGSDVETLTDLLCIFLDTFPDIDVKMRRELFTGTGCVTCEFAEDGGVLPHMFLVPREDFELLASLAPDKLEDLEKLLDPPPLLENLVTTQPDLVACYVHQYGGSSSSEASCIPGLLLCATISLAEHSKQTVADIIAQVTVSNVNMYDFLFKPEVLRILQSQHHWPTFTQFATQVSRESSHHEKKIIPIFEMYLSKRGFSAVLTKINLEVGMAGSPESRAMLQVFKQTQVLDRTFSSVAPSGRMNISQYEEALARLAFHAESTTKACNALSIFKCLINPSL